LPFVDDAKVTIGGISAGGYMTLMLAAETFPLTAAAPMVPCVNLGYQTEYIRYNHPHVKGEEGRPDTSPVPVLAIIYPIVADPGVFTYYPRDVDDPAWFKNSPIAHADTITCPVLAVFSTADTAVPIHQVSRELIHRHDPKLFPPGFKVDPMDLMRSGAGTAALLPVLTQDRYTLTVVPAPSGWPIASAAEAAAGKKRSTGGIPVWDIPFTGSKQWDIVVLDEVFPNYEAYIRAKVAEPISPEQLTARKLERLMARYAGVEWLDSGLRRLDRPEAERADVLRGLLTYVNQGRPHARRFVELYAALPVDRQALGPAGRFESPATVAAALQALHQTDAKTN
jgi:hypothetical protein